MYEIKVGNINTPTYRFVDADILSIDRVSTVDMVTENLSIDEFTANVISQNANLRNLSYGTPIWFYRNGVLMGKYYSKVIERVAKREYKISCMSAIGLFDTQTFIGGMYTGQTFNTVVNQIIGGAVTYSCEQDVLNTTIYGWIPYGTKREALQQLMFATSATLTKDANGDLRFSYIYSSSPTVIQDVKVYNEGTVDYGSPASGVSVTEHSFIANSSDTLVTIFDNTTSGETANRKLLIFDDAPLHSLSATGLTVNASNCNYAIVTGVGKLTGKKYTHRRSIVEKSIVTSGANKTVYIENAYLVNAVNSDNVATRLLAYYSAKKVVKSAFVLADEQCGRKVRITNPWDLASEDGYISKMEVASSGIEKASCELITNYTPQGQGNAYTGSVVLTGSGRWTVPSGRTSIKVILIGGGQGGQSGGASYKGEDGAKLHSGEGGNGGVHGSPGSGGKVFVQVLSVSGGASITYSCGAGGNGGTPSGTTPQNGSAGGNTTLTANGTTYSSGSGTVTPNGYQNIFTGVVYARQGVDDAVDGGKGGQSNARTGEGYNAQSVSYGGQTWSGGSQGSLNYDGSHVGGGGGGSGACVGANGNNGANGSEGGYGGRGGNGVTPPRRAAATVIGQGGLGSHGSSGGGGGGATSEDSWTYDPHYGVGGSAASGQYGGNGGAGGIIIYY